MACSTWAPRRSLVSIAQASSLHLSCIPPLFWYLSQVADRDGLLTNTVGVVAFLIAAAIHTVDVATSVFGVKLHSHRHTT
jgi:hypothetical protein